MRFQRSLKRGRATPRPKMSQASLRLELLENRTVPSILTISNRTLTYTADPGVGNFLTVTYDSGTNRYTFADLYPYTGSRDVIRLGDGTQDCDGDLTDTATCPAGALDALVLNLGDNSDTINLLSTADATTVNLGAGSDQFNLAGYVIGRADGTCCDYLGDGALDGIRAAVSVTGQGGDDDQLWVNDWYDGNANTYTITNGAVTRDTDPNDLLDNVTISYDSSLENGLDLVRLNMSRTNDGVANVLSTAAYSRVGISMKSGGIQTVNIGVPGQPLTEIRAKVWVVGEKGADADPVDHLNIYDQGNAGNEYTVEADNVTHYYTVSRPGLARIEGANLLDLRVYAGSQGDTFHVLSTLEVTDLYLYGGAGNDAIKLLSTPAGQLRVDGQTGLDTLDCSAYPGPVLVDLAAGTATGATGGIVGIENVVGSAFDDLLRGNAAANILQGGGGHDILVGGAGADRLEGGVGRNLLIGGAGVDQLVSLAGAEDILIGGFTVWDGNNGALNAIRAQWTLALPQVLRRANLMNGPFRLRNVGADRAVFDDFVNDLVWAQAEDWVIAS